MPFGVADVIGNVKYIRNGDYRTKTRGALPPPITIFVWRGGYGPPCSAAYAVGKTVLPTQFLHSSILYKKKFFANIGCFLFRSKKEIVHFMSLEVPHERVTIMGELGRGAFGKVHKGVMKEVTNANIYPDTSERNPNVHSKDSLRTLKDNEGRIVAVKVLLGELLSHFRRMFTNHVQPARC